MTEVRHTPFRRILCPVDFSPLSGVALRYAVAVAARTGGRVTAMYADDPMLAAAAAAGYDETMLKNATLSELRRMLTQAGVAMDRDPAPADVMSALGRPPHEIVKAARQQKADLIVMGTQGRSGAGRLFFGSTTAQVLRDAPAPVLAIPALARPAPRRWPGGPMLGAVDLGGGDRRQVHRMASLARALESDLVLVHAVAKTAGPPWLASPLRLKDRDRLAAARSRLETLASSIDGTAAKSHVLLGEPAAVISKLAADIRAGVVVVMLRPGHGLLAPRQGSITYRILCESSAPVLALTAGRERQGR
jgi:nucleotide-binding universal stress UspA family protein